MSAFLENGELVTVSAAKPLPVAQTDGLSVSGTATSAAVLFTTSMLNYESITVQVTSAGTSCIITYETSDDNSNWVSTGGLSASADGTLAISTTSTTAIMSQFSRKGLYFRARVSTYGSGTVTVIGTLSKAPVVNMLPAINIASAATRSQITVTRPANTTAYSAGDVIGGVITFTNMGAAASMQMLTSVDLRIDIAAIPSGMSSLRLHFYNVTPPSAYADNAAWDLPSGDRSAYIGYIDLGTPSDLGSTLFCQVDSANKQMKMGAGETSIYAYLVTTGGFTPAANSEVYIPTLRAVAL